MPPPILQITAFNIADARQNAQVALSRANDFNALTKKVHYVHSIFLSAHFKDRPHGA